MLLLAVIYGLSIRKLRRSSLSFNIFACLSSAGSRLSTAFEVPAIVMLPSFPLVLPIRIEGSIVFWAAGFSSVRKGLT